MENLVIAAAFNSREAYDYIKQSGQETSFSPLASLVFRALQEYYDADRDVGSASRELIESRLLGRITNDKHAAPLKQYLRDLPQDISSVNVVNELRELHRRAIGGKLSLALANGSPQEEVEKLIKKYQEGDKEAVNVTSSELVDLATYMLNPPEEAASNYIKLLPPALNDAVAGRCGKGNHILIFAYTNTGKTTFVVNMVAGFVNQGLRTLYVFNEEPVMNKIAGRLLKTNPNDVSNLPPEKRAKLGSITDKIVLAKLDSFSPLRKILATAQPPYDVVVLDQLRNMRVKAESRTIELEAAAIEARAIGRDFNALVISVTQGTANAESKVFLDKSDVDSSKVGIPGATDLMIGLGADPAMKANGLLGVSICKSKFGPDARFTATANFSTGVVS